MLFVGGFSHSPNIGANLWLWQKKIQVKWEKLNVDLYIVGTDSSQKVKNPKLPGIVFKGFVSDDEMENLNRKTRIIVSHFRYGAEVKGEIIGVLNYGVPIVTTSIGAEGISDIDIANMVTGTPIWLCNSHCLYIDDE